MTDSPATSTKPFWTLPAAAVWVATRDVAKADSLWDQRTTRAVGGALGDEAGAEGWRTVWRAALDQLTQVLVAGALRARSANGDVPAEAWMLPVRNGAQGLVVGATVEGPAMRPAREWHKAPLVGGTVPIFRPAEVMTAFPATGGFAAAAVQAGAKRRGRGRPKVNNARYIERAADMLGRGDGERAVRAYLKVSMGDELGIGASAVDKRLAREILPEARARIGKK